MDSLAGARVGSNGTPPENRFCLCKCKVREPVAPYCLWKVATLFFISKMKLIH